MIKEGVSEVERRLGGLEAGLAGLLFRLNNLHVLCEVEGRLRVGQAASDFAFH